MLLKFAVCSVFRLLGFGRMLLFIRRFVHFLNKQNKNSFFLLFASINKPRNRYYVIDMSVFSTSKQKKFTFFFLLQSVNPETEITFIYRQDKKKKFVHFFNKNNFSFSSINKPRNRTRKQHYRENQKRKKSLDF